MHVSTDVVPRKLRRRFLETPIAKWLVPEERCIALPVADKRKRFFVPLCVLILVLTLVAIAMCFQDGVAVRYSRIVNYP